MKKVIFLLLIFMVAVMGLSCAVIQEGDRAVVQTMDTAPSSPFGERAPISYRSDPEPLSAQVVETESVEEVPAEPSHFRDDIPLTREEQEWLWSACEEFEVPYALALGLIEKETDFTNMVGDDGASTGYMQVQEKWHRDRMERLGVTDLLDPKGNFRVGLDFLSELYNKYDDWALALTVYNMGHSLGYITNYAKDVMENYARWQTLVETDI